MSSFLLFFNLRNLLYIIVCFHTDASRGTTAPMISSSCRSASIGTCRTDVSVRAAGTAATAADGERGIHHRIAVPTNCPAQLARLRLVPFSLFL